MRKLCQISNLKLKRNSISFNFTKGGRRSQRADTNLVYILLSCGILNNVVLHSQEEITTLFKLLLDSSEVNHQVLQVNIAFYNNNHITVKMQLILQQFFQPLGSGAEN